MTQLEIATERSARCVVLSLRGELDLATSSELSAVLRQALDEGARQIVVDLRGVCFLDASGLGLLVRHHQRARSSGAELIVVKGPPQVHKLFELTNLSDRLSMVDEPPRRD